MNLNKKISDKQIRSLFGSRDLTDQEMDNILTTNKRRAIWPILSIAAGLVLVAGMTYFLISFNHRVVPACQADPFFVEMIKTSVDDFNRYRKENPDKKIELCNANLQNLNLANINLEGMTLDRANLSGSTLTNANLRKALITNSTMTSSVIRNTDMTAIHITNSTFEAAKVDSATIDSADITNVDFKDAVFSHSTILFSRLLTSDFRNTQSQDNSVTNSKFISCTFENTGFADKNDSAQYNNCLFNCKGGSYGDEKDPASGGSAYSICSGHACRPESEEEGRGRGSVHHI
jgi:hypothetical protein